MLTEGDIDGMMSEINAGKCIHSHGEAEQSWNNATERALSIIRKYQSGRGLLREKRTGDQYFAKMEIQIDPSLPPNVVEMRNDAGEVLGRIVLKDD